VRAAVASAQVEGRDNLEATRQAGIVILSVPFEHTAETVKAIRAALAPGQIVVSMGVPLATALGDSAVRTVGVWQGSCAELVAELVPEGVEVVSAFQNVSAHRLQELAEPVECDVVVSGAKEARGRVMELCALVPGLRAVDGGPLANARIVEAITALMIGLNVRYGPRRVGSASRASPRASPAQPSSFKSGFMRPAGGGRRREARPRPEPKCAGLKGCVGLRMSRFCGFPVDGHSIEE
jgi:NADPH-dependent F420 reductase